MIDTNDIKRQLDQVFRIGNENSEEVILILGSCRSVFYLNYLDIYNRSIGNKYLIYNIEPLNYYWDNLGKAVNSMADYMNVIEGLETNQNILNILKKVKIFIHESHINYGMFNCDKSKKSIYDFGMNPEIDICIPAFDDIWVLFNDHIKYNSIFKAKAQNEYRSIGTLTAETQNEIKFSSLAVIDKIIKCCENSDFPEIGELFKNEWTKQRLFYVHNHIGKGISIPLFKLMNEKFLHFDINCWKEIEEITMFDNVVTPICKYDVSNYGLEWNEPIVNFKEYNSL